MPYIVLGAFLLFIYFFIRTPGTCARVFVCLAKYANPSAVVIGGICRLSSACNNNHPSPQFSPEKRTATNSSEGPGGSGRPREIYSVVRMESLRRDSFVDVDVLRVLRTGTLHI